MSTHSVNIVEIPEVLPHDNADRLGIVHINGWSCVVAKDQFKTGDKAVYVEPDYVVSTSHPAFAFLAKGKEGKLDHRMKAIRLRGQLSFGLLIPVPEDLQDLPVGSDVMEPLGIRRYEPPIRFMKAGADDSLPQAEWPQLYMPKFDLEDLRKFENLMFAPGDRVFVTEKLHGGNARVVWHNNQLYIGSRNRWLKPDSRSAWTHSLLNDEQFAPGILEFCKKHPDVTFYGEVYGPVQELRYGLTNPRFACFAALEKDQWWDMEKLYNKLTEHNIHRAPLLYVGPFDRELIAALGETDSEIESAGKGHMKEGVVIVAEPARMHPNLGRVALKLISNRYWLS